jgi:hypothetical protein
MVGAECAFRHLRGALEIGDGLWIIALSVGLVAALEQRRTFLLWARTAMAEKPSATINMSAEQMRREYLKMNFMKYRLPSGTTFAIYTTSRLQPNECSS